MSSFLLKLVLINLKIHLIHHVKSVRIRCFFLVRIFLYLDWIRRFVNLRIQSEYRKMWTRKISAFGYFSRSDTAAQLYSKNNYLVTYTFSLNWSYTNEKAWTELVRKTVQKAYLMFQYFFSSLFCFMFARALSMKLVRK